MWQTVHLHSSAFKLVVVSVAEHQSRSLLDLVSCIGATVVSIGGT